MSTQNLPNPYHHDYGDDVETAPFAGRADTLARIYRHLARSDANGALCILGRRHIGKTALLHAARALFTESHLGAYISPRAVPITDETDWLLTWAQTVTSSLISAGYTTTRLNELPPPEGDVRVWFEKTFLPAILGALRGTRRLLFVVDDGDEWLHAIRSGTLPADSISYTNSLIGRADHPIDVIIALGSEYEHQLPAFAPLVSVTNVIRLRALTRPDAEWLLREPVRASYEVADSAINAALVASGGAPGLLQQFGYLMYRKWSINSVHSEMTAEDIKAMLPTVYAYGERDYAELWHGLNTNERLTLTAISSITQSDPGTPITAERIESWLVETDYPLDLVSINAAVRGLEYSEAVILDPGEIRLNGGLLHSWLIDHARLGDRVIRSERPPARASDRRARVDVSTRLAERRAGNIGASRRSSIRLIMLFALALLISTAILIASVASDPRSVPAATAPPTATLIGTPP